MTEPENVVSVRDLRKSYGDTAVVDGLTFDIRAGETFALLGPNGAGKSTAIEILEGYRSRSGGEVSVLGTDPQHGGVDWRARLGIVLQETGETGNVTVREQLDQFSRYYARPRDVDEVMSAVGLEGKGRMLIRKLSGGQRRRVDVALGIVGRPELLFLDEPTTGFDPEARRNFWDLILRLKAEGTTILLTTHYLDEAAHLSDRVGVLLRGRLIDSGTLDEIGDAEARVPVVRWTDADGRHDVRSETPGAVVAALMESGREPENLEIVRPSLEDVYLALVTDRDAADAAEAAHDPGADPARLATEATR
ncbi:putative ABC transporter ATP-binding protein YbhF [Frondihabitans sp. 762G35]|uniref:ABC transporter ATP-binding protein n=1 Tax=Frondihabitans sp. 762G35 TaxID=1446794 RepID=UPI000D202B08|nr:ABC transporter ATP-binding protein [Frondihabitans sp. 762G35]ARC57381.1 putative ABC transporter ATP-binding protein YbhF [Frondihabitans sp. 762G35]